MIISESLALSVLLKVVNEVAKPSLGGVCQIRAQARLG
jgi:hypothetical protein